MLEQSLGMANSDGDVSAHDGSQNGTAHRYVTKWLAREEKVTDGADRRYRSIARACVLRFDSVVFGETIELQSVSGGGLRKAKPSTGTKNVHCWTQRCAYSDYKPLCSVWFGATEWATMDVDRTRKTPPNFRWREQNETRTERLWRQKNVIVDEQMERRHRVPINHFAIVNNAEYQYW